MFRASPTGAGIAHGHHSVAWQGYHHRSRAAVARLRSGSVITPCRKQSVAPHRSSGVVLWAGRTSVTNAVLAFTSAGSAQARAERLTDPGIHYDRPFGTAFMRSTRQSAGASDSATSSADGLHALRPVEDGRVRAEPA